MTSFNREGVAALMARLRSPLPVCPYDKRSPDYFTAPDDKPCVVCGSLNEPSAPNLCRGADTRCMEEAATALSTLAAEIERAERALLTVQNAAKTIAAAHGTELEHLRQNASFDHNLRAEVESLRQHNSEMTDALLASEARTAALVEERDAARAGAERRLRCMDKRADRLIELQDQLAKAREAARRAHDTLTEIDPDSYTHADVVTQNAASVEAIYLLADLLGETHGKTPAWWAARREAREKEETKPRTWRDLDDKRLQLAIDAFYEPCEGTTIDGVRAAILAWEAQNDLPELADATPNTSPQASR